MVDVFCENYTLIDWEVHDMWIRGLSVNDAVAQMKANNKTIFQEYPGVTHDVMASDVNDHYRLFSMLENVLLTVGNFEEQASV